MYGYQHILSSKLKNIFKLYKVYILLNRFKYFLIYILGQNVKKKKNKIKNETTKIGKRAISNLYVLNSFKYFLIYILGPNVPILPYCILLMHEKHCSKQFGSSSFFSYKSFFEIQKFHHLLGCHAIGINSSLIFF